MSKYYTIKITGGTSPGPYTIFHTEILNNLYIPTIYDSAPPRLATDLSWEELSYGSGIIVTVPDNTTTLFLYNQYCPEESLTTNVSSIMCFTYRGIGGGGLSTFSCSVSAGDSLYNGKRWWDLNNCPVNSTLYPGFTCPKDVGFVWWNPGLNKWNYSRNLGELEFGNLYSTLYDPSSNEYPIPFGGYVWLPELSSTCSPEMINSTFGPCVSENPQTLIPPKIVVYEEFCLTITNSKGAGKFLNFTSSSLVNGFPSWVDSLDPSITVTYNNTNWVLNGYTLGSGSIISNDSPTSNPPSNWVIIGAVGNNTITYNVGGCGISKRTSLPVSINQPTCLCDGSIIFNITLDNPPFVYSIDNGVTYSSSPIFTNLCSGIYILSVVDSLGETYSNTVTLNKPELAKTYILKMDTILTTPVKTEISLVNSYTTTFEVTPPLPDGTTITFDLIHSNSFYSSPMSGTSILTTGTVLDKNLISITNDSVVTGNTQSTNTTPGCQSDFIYQSDINEVWNSVTLTNTDTITISTTTRVDKTTTGLCVVGYSNDTYSITNAVISGCDCCSLIVNT